MPKKIIKSTDEDIDMRLGNCSSYDEVSGDLKQDIKKLCLKEQEGLCAYCYRKISVSTSNIEHVVPRSKDPGRQNDYSNMVASCLDKETCNAKRGNRDLPLTPFDDEWELAKLKYSGEFSYKSEVLEQSFNILNVGNLNKTLVAKRKDFINSQLNLLSNYMSGARECHQDIKLLAQCLYRSPSGEYLHYGPFVEEIILDKISC